MTYFETMAFIVGCLVMAIMGIIFLTVLLYAVSALIAFIVLSLKLNSKRVSEVIIQPNSTFGNKSKYASRCTNVGWPTQYVKYVVGNYLQIVWGRWISKMLNHLTSSKDEGRNNKGQKDIINLSPIPFNDKPLKSIHDGNLAQGGKGSQPKWNVTLQPLPCFRAI